MLINRITIIAYFDLTGDNKSGEFISCRKFVSYHGYHWQVN